ncbi:MULTISPECIES: ABC transporter substrate-binding protein [unclassified Bradyrhizobium]|uniref:ABC transporter substrate-binding protein n=1 Tax=unclassified Bradyrhizobium TaxID=2631580 RepID=UPI002013BCA6|nr:MULTISPECIES: ABC transporter substrate-binding protein [unclassified Bradyrhizobium]
MASGASAGLVALSGRISSPAVAQARTIRIGHVSPQSGALALFGESDQFVLAGIRDAFKNGITVAGRTYPLEIISKDTQSSPNRAAEVANELISGDKVDIVVVASGPETVNPVSDQCELNGVPCISSICPWQPWMFARGGAPEKGFDSTFHFFWGFEDIMAVFSDMWDLIPTNRKVGGIFPNDEDGRAWGDPVTGAPARLKAREYAVTSSGFYKGLSDDFTAIISNFKRADCQIITGAPIPPDFTTFWTQARQQGFRPKVASVAKAILFPAAVEALGDAAHNLSSEVWWSPHHPFRSSVSGFSADKLAAAYTSATGKQWTQPIGFIHAMFETATDVIKRTADIGDRKAVIAAIRETSLDTVVGKVDWKNTSIRNVAKTPLVGGQWRLTKGGKYKYDLVITSNATALNIKANGEMQPLA